MSDTDKNEQTDEAPKRTQNDERGGQDAVAANALPASEPKMPADADDDITTDSAGAEPSGEDQDDAGETAGEADAGSVRQRSGAPATIAWLALFLSLVTVAGVGYLLLEQMRAKDSAAEEGQALSRLAGDIETTESSLGELSEDLDALASAEAQTNAAIEALRRDLDGRAQLFDSLPPRMTSLERSIASLQGVSIDARNTYLIAEAEYYLQIANAQLQLAGNAYLASLALEQADDRLLQLADPALTDVRRAIADEIAALEVMEKPDIAGVAMTLASLARVVESLPLNRVSRETSAGEAGDAEAQGGAARAWGAVKNAFSGLVRHTPPGDENAPLLTPDAEPLIRSNLSLKLQAARLALLRGEPSIFEQSLDDALAWIDTYFDKDSEAVTGATETIAELRDDYGVTAAPDISGSLKLLRQYKALAESAE